jgi:hypothetical protein
MKRQPFFTGEVLTDQIVTVADLIKEVSELLGAMSKEEETRRVKELRVLASRRISTAREIIESVVNNRRADERIASDAETAEASEPPPVSD